MAAFTITPRGDFSLQEAATFGFGQRHDSAYDATMRLAFCLDGTFQPVSVALTQSADGVVVGVGDSSAAVVAQVARVLSLDIDGAGFPLVGKRDPVIGRLQAVARGLRPPLFHSAYEAAAWCVLSARRPAGQMQAVRTRLNNAHGRTFTLAGQELACFPTPSALLGLTEIPGLDYVKVQRLHAVAQAALDGWLDTLALRALDPADARSRLERLPGIGPLSSSLIVVRALGHPDVLPEEEPRAMALLGELYGLGGPATAAQLREIGASWSPYRTWALVLVRAAAGRLTAQTAGAVSSR